MRSELYKTNNEILFERIRHGDVKAFEYAFRKFGPRLEAFARKYVTDPSEAEDIVQDSFLKLWERRELLQNISLTSYLFMLVRNASLNLLKHQAVAETTHLQMFEKNEVERLYAIDFEGDPASALMEKELSDSIESIMQSLPERCKEVFSLSRLNGFKNREIAAKLNISEKVVEKHIARALKRFREGLKQFATWLFIWLHISGL